MAGIALDTLPQVFTHAQALAHGLSDRALYEMRDNGTIKRIARGIYAQPGFDGDPDLIEIAVRAPNATMCLTSALAHHELTDDIPAQINIALPRTQRQPATHAPVSWHRFDTDTYNTGRDTTPITGELSIGIYNPTRSIIDAYRLRHLYGTDQALQALKRWLRTPAAQPSDLLDMAKHFPATTTVIRTTLQTLL